MRLPSFPCAAALLLAGLVIEPGLAAEPVRAAIETCRSRIDAQVDVGYARIASRCPELVRLLESGEWEDWLPRSWREPANDLSIGGLEELATLIEREGVRGQTGRRPGTAKLRAVLVRLEAVQTRDHGPWSRFRQWLETVFAQPTDDGASAWLERLLERATPSQLVIEAITYMAVALIVVLALAIVVNELRAAGALSRRRTRGRKRTAVELPTDAPLSPRELERASLQERPALLLRLVFDRLAQVGRLPRAASLTIREAQMLVAISDPADRARLAELSSAAEQVRYAARPAAPGILSRALEAGAALLASLESAKAQRS